MHNYAGRVAIVGVTGYTGQELDRLLTAHPKFQIAGKFASKADEKSGAEAFSLDRLRSYTPDAVILATGGYGNVFYLSTNAKGSNVTAIWRAYIVMPPRAISFSIA